MLFYVRKAETQKHALTKVCYLGINDTCIIIDDVCN